MIYDNLLFHNVGSIKKMEGKKGVRLQRLSQEAINGMSEHGQKLILSPVANVEIRFLLEGDSFEITLSSEFKGLRMHVAWGDLWEKGSYDINDYQTTIRVRKSDEFKRLKTEHYDSEFDIRLVRLSFAGDYETPVYYHGINGDGISVPKKENVPQKKILFYGTSITAGAGCTTPYMTYPYIAARRLGMDLINLGVSGGAFCERSVTDYISLRDDWDIAVLSLSVNMYNNPDFSIQVFKERTSQMIEKVAVCHPEKPIFCITIFPFFEDIEIYREGSDKNAEEYRQIIRDIVDDLENVNVHILEGKALLDDIKLLSPDLLHPTDLGMVEIGRNLACWIKRVIPKKS